MSYSQTVSVGNVGRDPEMRITPSGREVCDVSIAITRKWKNSDGQLQEETTWQKWTAWGATAQTMANYVRKGQQHMFVGRLNEARAYQKTDGTCGAQSEFTVERLILLNNGRRADGETAEAEPDFGADFA